MKILSLDIDGFRSLKHIAGWRPGNLSVLIGPNSSGKSNLLRVLELLAAAAQGGVGKLVQTCGGMEPLIWDGAVDAIRLKVKCSPVDTPQETGCHCCDHAARPVRTQIRLPHQLHDCYKTI